MRRTYLAALTALTLTLIGAGAGAAVAQPVPPAAGPGPDGGPPHHMMDWMRHHMGGDRDGMRDGSRGPINPRDLGLVFGQADKQLTPADVQKIAEAFLLWRGNHTWKVTEVKAVDDKAIGFALSLPDGAVVARFTMDPHTGRVTRTS